jgi:hypothetical protein
MKNRDRVEHQAARTLVAPEVAAAETANPTMQSEQTEAPVHRFQTGVRGQLTRGTNSLGRSKLSGGLSGLPGRAPTLARSPLSWSPLALAHGRQAVRRRSRLR